MRMIVSVKVVAVLIALTSCAWAQTAGSEAVQVEVSFLEAKTDGTGFDPRIKTSLGKTLREHSKGSPSPAAPFDRFDSYAWIGRELRDLHLSESVVVPVPLTQSTAIYLEYRGRGDVTGDKRHAITFAVRSKSGELKNKMDLKLEDGGTFLQGMTISGGRILVLGTTVTAIKK